MLGTFRDKIVKWGVQLLFVLLILSFGVWGIGDYVGFTGPGGGDQTIAEVGETKIAAREFQLEMQNQIQRMRQVFGDSFGPEQARAMGIEESVLQSMIQEALFAAGARDIGLVVSDAQVAEEIRRDPRFQTAGTFDRTRFDQFLRQAGLSEGQYAGLLREELLRRQYLSPIALARAAPEGLVEAIYRHRNERRIAQVLTLPHASIADVPEPSPEELAKFHEEHAEQFTAPEYRAVSVVRLRPEDVMDEIDIPDESLRTYYQQHIPEFSEPERRTIEQALFADEAAARAAHERIAAGEDFAKVVQDTTGAQGEALTLGTLARNEVPIPELSDVAFSLETGAVSDPIRTALGWHLLRVAAIEPASQKSFEEVRGDIRERLAGERAADVLYELSTQFEDELGGGASVEEAARQLKLNVVKIDAVDQSGRDPQGNPVGIGPEITRAAFETSEGDSSALNDLGASGYFMVQVDKVTPRSLKPLDEVSDEVVAAWRDSKRAERAEAIAKQMAEEIRSGKLLSDVAQEHGAELSTTQPFTRNRQGLDRPLPGDVVSALFKSRQGTPEVGQLQDAHVVAVVSEIVPADPQGNASARRQLEQELGSAIANDISASLASALRARLDVTINRASLESAY